MPFTKCSGKGRDNSARNLSLKSTMFKIEVLQAIPFV